jgi:phage pi2 protein 07
MWVRTYDKSGGLVQSAKLDSEGNTESFYSISGKEYTRFNIWGSDKVLEFQVSDEDLELVENREGAKFFRCVSKHNKKGGINYPTYKKKISIENGEIINFNIDKQKIQQWKTKAKKTDCQKRIKTI